MTTINHVLAARSPRKPLSPVDFVALAVMSVNDNSGAKLLQDAVRTGLMQKEIPEILFPPTYPFSVVSDCRSLHPVYMRPTYMGTKPRRASPLRQSVVVDSVYPISPSMTNRPLSNKLRHLYVLQSSVK